jgi:competence protein CoiA
LFVANDLNGNKVNPFDTPIEDLRFLSRAKQLFCPECETVVRFASGEQVTAHFKHVNSPDCTYDSEPETEEHIKGKILIRNWLVNRYPNVKVEFEYKIKETNQRADVMAIFPQGKIAFEMQCSKIQGSVWRERHELYRKAGVLDYWILGNSVHKYGKTNGEIDNSKHQLVSLASSIFEETENVLFLNTVDGSIKGIYKHNEGNWYSDTIYTGNEENFTLNEASVYKEFIGTKMIKNLYLKWQQNRLLREKQLREYEEQCERDHKKWEKERIVINNLREQQIQNYLVDLGESTLKTVLPKMNFPEREMFNRLIKKYQFSEDTFPGLFNVYTPYNYLIFTPHQLWQLWIYDKYIYKKKKNKNKIWIPTVKDEFYKTFRVKTRAREYDDHFSFAIYDYFARLGSMNIVHQLGYTTTKYQEICYDLIPPFPGKEAHHQIACFLSFDDEDEWKHYLTDEMKETAAVYKSLIQNYTPIESTIINSIDESTLEYIINLLLARPELSNEWEKSFMKNMWVLIKSKNVLSEKQLNRVLEIKNRIEKALQISLSSN